MKSRYSLVILIFLRTVNLVAQTTSGITENEYYDSLMSIYRYENYPFELKCEFTKVADTIVWGQLNGLPQNIMENIDYQFKRDNPNFGSCYKIVIWGCGSPCQMLAVFESQTGTCLGTLNASLGFDFKPNSRLIIANPPMNETMDLEYRRDVGAEPEFYELRNGKVKKVANKTSE